MSRFADSKYGAYRARNPASYGKGDLVWFLDNHLFKEMDRKEREPDAELTNQVRSE